MHIPNTTYFGNNLSKPSKIEAIREQALVAKEKAHQTQQQEFQEKQRDFLNRKLLALKINGQKTVLTGRDFLTLFQPGLQFTDEQWGYSETDPPGYSYSASTVAWKLEAYLTDGQWGIAQIVPIAPFLPKLPFSKKTLEGELEKMIEVARSLNLIKCNINQVSGPHRSLDVQRSYRYYDDELLPNHKYLFHYDVTIGLSEAAQSLLRGAES